MSTEQRIAELEARLDRLEKIILTMTGKLIPKDRYPAASTLTSMSEQFPSPDPDRPGINPPSGIVPERGVYTPAG